MTSTDVIPHGTASGYSNHGCRCDECRSYKREIARRYYESNQKKINERNLLWYYANREQAIESAKRRQKANRPAATAATERWRQNHPDRYRESVLRQNSRPETVQRRREWAQRNPERVRAASARWAAKPENKEKVRLAAKLRRARTRAAETRDYTPRDWLRQLHRQRHRCFYCEGGGVMTADHVIPLTRGGRHSVGNIVAACKSCNSSKHNHLVVEWRSRRRS